MGFSVVTTVLAKAASYDLTDLATVKDELSIGSNSTSSDGWLSRAIAQLSQMIASHTKRVFAPEMVQDSFDIQQDPYPYQTPGGFPQLQLTRWPVLSVLSVVQTIALNTTQVLTEGTDFKVDPATGQLLRLNPFTGVGTIWEALPVTVQYTAGFGDLVVEPDTIPAVSPFTVEVDFPVTFSCDQVVSFSNGGALTRVSANPGAGQYSVTDGVYAFNEADASTPIIITYAVLDVPADLVDITLRLVTGRYKAKDRDPSLIQMDTPGVGTQRFWFGGAPGQTGPFPPDITGALDPYCMPVVV